MAGKKLLVADDSLTIQKVIKLALSNTTDGYEIQTVSDGKDAVQQISVFRPDIVLVDVSLPGKTAFELKREINELHDLAHTRFVLMSSAFEKVDEIQAEEVQFHGRLTKPFDPAHLREVLHQVVATVAQDHDPTFVPPPPPLSPLSALSSIPGISPPPPSELPAFDAPPMPAPASATQETTNVDIKELTESTIRMSGLDDFQWSINEPSLKPPANVIDSADSDFPLERFPQFQEPVAQEESRAQEPTIEVGYAPPPPSSYGPPVTAEEIQEIVRKQVEETLTQMARQLLPNLAEKLIKEEIHRMLSEQA